MKTTTARARGQAPPASRQTRSTPPPSPPTTREVRLVAITSGGPRKHALLAAFERRPTVWDASISRKALGEATSKPVPGFFLEFVGRAGRGLPHAQAHGAALWRRARRFAA